jgi:hypothetical protein
LDEVCAKIRIKFAGTGLCADPDKIAAPKILGMFRIWTVFGKYFGYSCWLQLKYLKLGSVFATFLRVQPHHNYSLKIWRKTWMGSIGNVDCGSLKHGRAVLPAGLQNQFQNFHESPGLGSPQIKNYALI